MTNDGRMNADGPPRALSIKAALGRLAVIGAIMLGAAALFGYTGGWLSPHRLTPDRMVAALSDCGGDPLATAHSATFSRDRPHPSRGGPIPRSDTPRRCVCQHGAVASEDWQRASG
jgi:hypothetical protein